MADSKKSYQQNQVIFVGNVANDPTQKIVKVGESEKAIAEFRLINHRGDAMTTVTIKAWAELAPTAMSTLKGSLVKVEGSLSIRRNKNADGVTFTEVSINAKTITTLATKKIAAGA